MRKTTLLLLIVALGCSQKKHVDLMIESGSVIDVATGEILSGKIIVVTGDSIDAVVDSSEKSKYQPDQIIDASGKFILPGLWDTHVHFGGGDSLIQENKNLLPLYVAHGITAVRDCAADLSPSVLQWRREINEGRLLGPTLFTSGPKLEGDKSVWVGDIEVDTEQEMLAGIDSLQKLHVDFIKITDNTLRPDLYLSILREAKKRGMKTSGHVPFVLTIDQVSAEGLGTIEHLGYLLKAGSPREKELAEQVASGKITPREASPLIAASFDETYALESYKRLAAQGTAIVPTVTISKTLAYLDKDDHSTDPYLQYIGVGLQKTYVGRVKRAATDDAAAVEARHKNVEKVCSILPLLQRAGVSIIAGTDAGYLNSFVYPGIALHQELEYFVQYGLTPLQALQAAILRGPEFLGKQKYFGAVRPGKVADMLILNENPLNDIRATQKINTVILKGKVFDRAALDSLLDEVRKSAATR